MLTLTVIEIVILMIIPAIFISGFLGLINLGFPEDWWIATFLEIILAVLILLVRSFL